MSDRGTATSVWWPRRAVASGGPERACTAHQKTPPTTPTGPSARGWHSQGLEGRAASQNYHRRLLPRADAAVLVWHERPRAEERPAQCRCRNLPLPVAHASRRRDYPPESPPSGSSDSDVPSTPSVASPCNGSSVGCQFLEGFIHKNPKRPRREGERETDTAVSFWMSYRARGGDCPMPL